MNPIRPYTLRGIKSTQGGILITTVLLIVIMTMMSAAILYRVSSRHAATYMSVVWNEALSSAEAGTDFAVQTLNNSIANPGTAWTGWTPGDATTFPKTINFNPASHIGESNTKVFAKLTVDNMITDGSGAKWMRIRSQGVAECPHISNGTESGVLDSNGVKNHRTVLRKARFTTDITGGALNLPQISRTIEVMAQPLSISPYIRALTVKNTISLSGGAYADSFDSSNPAYSTSGLYDAAKRQWHGDVASNAIGSLSDLRDCYVYGNASSNGGAIKNTANVEGSVFNNFQTTIPDIAAPVSLPWPAPTSINNPAGGITLRGGPAGSPMNYKLSVLTVSSGSNPLILAPSAPGVDSYINIWVTGKTTVSGSGFIQQQPNVHVTFYCDQDVTISGSGVMNQTNVASNLVMYGVTPASGAPKMTVSGSGNFIGVLNAPAFAMTISGSAAFVGAAIGNSVNISGSGGFHYDQALASTGSGSGTTYQVASWVEDIR